MKTREGVLILSSAGLLLVVALAYFLGNQGSTPGVQWTAQTATETPVQHPSLDLSAQPVQTASDAIDIARDRIPAGLAAHSPLARLITHQVFNQWEGGGSGFEESAPVWLVAFLVDGFDTVQAIPVAPPEMRDDIATAMTPEDNRPLEGLFYAIDANSGYLAAAGALDMETQRTYASVGAIADMVLPISQATAPPLVPTAASVDP